MSERTDKPTIVVHAYPVYVDDCGYGSQADGRGRDNAGKERIWFSPHCLKLGLFSQTNDASFVSEGQ